MEGLARGWNLPIQPEVGMVGEFCYCAHASGSRKHPVVYLRLFSGEQQEPANLVAYAYHSPFEGSNMWNIYVMADGKENSFFIHPRSQVATHTEALDTMVAYCS
jgi:hypothetical protein